MLYIPKRINDLLEKDQGLHGFVLSSIDNLSPWLKDNKTIFFPEYSDHGLTHLNEVLLTADSIISDDSWLYLTPEDSAAMITAILLHDCAMHLSEDGFYTLINDGYSCIDSRYFDKEEKWKFLWQEFMSEAKRFDGKKLNSIFGDNNPVKDLPENKIDLTGRDKLLIGEFIRRHHARIAHEIVFNGVPGCNGKTIKLGEISSDFLDLYGFIARSHNLDLRNAVDKLEKNKKRIHHNTHVPFIMLVLRISDYIQIHAERAPNQLLSIKSLISPISRGEWKKHNSIIEINQAHDDPDAIFIDAEPEDALIFKSLTALFEDIQRELDLSWSVLGEIYGRFKPLNKLGITIRRIRSTLDNIEDFLATKKPRYIPKVLEFRTADSEMMELLIAPLYGDAPEIGIRELMQNAVDACIELKDLCSKNLVSLEDGNNEGVSITVIDNGSNGGEVVIEDNGVGMTLEVVENYFLNIGASFRNSDNWKKEHETDGHSNVHRTGRFGIGLLAAYLLGNEIRVETRSVHEKSCSGLIFNCKKGGGPITILNIEKDIGTKISITINEEVKDYLIDNAKKWDWFSLESPKLERKIVSDDNDTVVLKQSRIVPENGSDVTNGKWRCIKAQGFDDIFWTYETVMRGYIGSGNRNLICNGVIVSSYLYLDDLNVSKKMRTIVVTIPSIVVFDQDGRLPINLERSGLVGKTVPFMEELTKDVSIYIAEKMIEHGSGINMSISSSKISELLKMSIKGLDGNSYLCNDDACKFIVHNEYLLPMDFDLIVQEKPESLYVDAANIVSGQGAWGSEEFKKLCTYYLVVDNITGTKNSRSSWVRRYFEFNKTTYNTEAGFSLLPIIGKRILIKKSDASDIVSSGYVPKTFWRSLVKEWENDRWSLLSLGETKKLDADVGKLCEELDETSSFGFVIYYFDWENNVEKENGADVSQFANAWLKLTGQTMLDTK